LFLLTRSNSLLIVTASTWVIRGVLKTDVDKP
jgi:hypothetical protein